MGRAGPAGATGADGPRGAQGERGATGDSIIGPAGPRGATGPEGLRGVPGGQGVEGPSTAGPTGRAGATGDAGRQGLTGATGARGATELGGIAGPAGLSGQPGAQGQPGATGAQGPLYDNGNPMVSGAWNVYREYNFANFSRGISSEDSDKAREISSHLARYPELRAGIDGDNVERSTAVRRAMIDAGVPDYKIQMGAFGDPGLRRDRRVAVLMRY